MVTIDRMRDSKMYISFGKFQKLYADVQHPIYLIMDVSTANNYLPDRLEVLEQINNRNTSKEDQVKFTFSHRRFTKVVCTKKWVPFGVHPNREDLFSLAHHSL